MAKRLILGLVGAILAAAPATAQNVTTYIGPNRKIQTVDAAHPLPVTSAAGSGGSTGSAQGATATGATGPMVQGRVVTGDQTYTVDTLQPFGLTASGRLRVATSYSGNLGPAANPASTTTSAIVGCQYRASPVTWLDTWTGSLRCDNNGRIATILELPLPAGTNALGSVVVNGPAASQTTISGAPVPMGCDYLLAKPVTTTGNRATVQCSATGQVTVALSGTTGLQAQIAAPGDGLTNNNALYVNAYNLVYNGTTSDRWRGESGYAYMIAKGGATLTTGQVSVGTTATLIAAAQAGRQSITINAGTGTCAIGGSTVTLTTGYLLPAAPDTTATSAAVYGVCSATTTVSFKAAS
jgi:hypothetical protein